MQKIQQERAVLFISMLLGCFFHVCSKSDVKNSELSLPNDLLQPEGQAVCGGRRGKPLQVASLSLGNTGPANNPLNLGSNLLTGNPNGTSLKGGGKVETRTPHVFGSLF